MCGRYSLSTPPEELEARFDVRFPDQRPRYNCAPGQHLPVVTTDGGTRMKWGLTPSWADESFDLINARAETLAEKRSFADAYESRRCLVPMDGFYEWAGDGDRDGGKRPYRVAFEDDRPFAAAGLWERWRPPTTQTGLGDFGGDSGPTESDAVETFTVVTTEPNDLIADLHHRMAVVLPEEAESTWLTGDVDEVADLLEPFPDDELRAYPVSRRVNDPSNDDPSLVDPVDV